ncbi:TonB-dependent receptor [Alteromonas aestuariivivens]|uniref:TonB-dependent receptor n=1 Tax=Alteromonas aestuariivivens TaxID=1938339 RepID=A0A3D8M8E1_9ALTE|nr:TonB-dependent receptor [Alteromonas aestuariivivens]RDV26059.1 TonB-dependent receptor [Alteromonas aestuariivivens]
MTQFKPNLIKAAFITSGFAFASVPAIAQEASADVPDENLVEVIQVSGIRGSLQRAQAIKMDNTSIVEALSAEDIGKLPDTSIAESLSRLPGLAGERRNGRTSGIAVRGFNENYVGTSLNGRELLGMGDNRGVEFDLYPTEFISNILVYKTPEAGMTTQNIGGSIDLQTVKPLTASSTFTLNGTYEQNKEDSLNPDFDNDGHRISLNYVDQFADDTLGFALTIASMESPRQEKQFRGWGYANVNLTPEGTFNDNGDPLWNPRRFDGMDTVDVPDGSVVLGGHDSFARSAMLERDSIASVIQWAPSDQLTVQLDALYIDFTEDDVRRGLEEGGAEWGTGAYTITGVEDGLVTSGYHDGFYSVVRNDARRQEAELKTFGLNVEYVMNDSWTMHADISSGKVDKNITDIESYSGVGRAGIDGRPLTARSWEMTSTGVMFSDHPTIAGVDLTDESLIRLAGPQAWGSSPVPGNLAQDGFVNNPDFEEQLTTYRFDVEGFVEWGMFTGVEFGAIYSDRTKSKDNNGAYLTGPSYPADDAIPDVLGVVSLDFIGIDGVLAYDSLGLYNSGYYTAVEAELVQNDRLGDTYTVNEKLTTLYGKLTLDTEFGGVYLRGNVGLQVVRADQQSTGFSTTSNANGYTIATPVVGGTDYTDVLPTLNLSAEVADSQFVRLGMSKVISRPRMDDMRPNTQATFSFNDNQILSTDIANGPWGGSSGNPELKPLEANQFDLAYENYFADSGYVAVSFFFKDIKNWHRDNAVVADFSDVYVPGLHQTSDGRPPVLFDGQVTSVMDGFEGFVRGWELQGSLPGDVIHDSLEGFGVFASATFMDGSADPAPGSTETRIPGLSEENYSLTFFYEKAGFEFRVATTKRSDYLTEERGLSLALQDATKQGGTLVDAQIGYDFSESGIDYLDGLRVTLQGQNLTDEDDIQASGTDPRQITQYQSFGANYLLSFNYEF